MAHSQRYSFTGPDGARYSFDFNGEGEPTEKDFAEVYESAAPSTYSVPFKDGTRPVLRREYEAMMAPKLGLAAPSPGERFADEFYGQLDPANLVEAVRSPVQTARGIVEQMREQSGKARQASREGRWVEGTLRDIASYVPIIGPGLMSAAEMGQSGDVAGGLGRSAGLGVGTALGVRTAPEVPPVGGAALEAAKRAKDAVIAQARRGAEVVRGRFGDVVKHPAAQAAATLAVSSDPILSAAVGLGSEAFQRSRAGAGIVDDARPVPEAPVARGAAPFVDEHLARMQADPKTFWRDVFRKSHDKRVARERGGAPRTATEARAEFDAAKAAREAEKPKAPMTRREVEIEAKKAADAENAKAAQAQDDNLADVLQASIDAAKAKKGGPSKPITERFPNASEPAALADRVLGMVKNGQSKAQIIATMKENGYGSASAAIVDMILKGAR